MFPSEKNVKCLIYEYLHLALVIFNTINQSILTNAKWGIKQTPIQTPMDEILSFVTTPTPKSKADESLNNVAKMTPLPIKDAPTINMANRNEGPNLFLGIKVIGPFLRNRVTPNEADRTLVANVARKNQSLGFMPLK